MTDNLTKEHRSWNMSRVPGSDTKPEVKIRSLLHRLGFRFIKHNKYLPGSPDITLPKYRTVVFVHGCFWHRHKNCKHTRTPKSRTDYWINKFNNNVRRDKHVVAELEELGWKVIIVWECEINDSDTVATKIAAKIKAR